MAGQVVTLADPGIIPGPPTTPPPPSTTPTPCSPLLLNGWTNNAICNMQGIFLDYLAMGTGGGEGGDSIALCFIKRKTKRNFSLTQVNTKILFKKLLPELRILIFIHIGCRIWYPRSIKSNKKRGGFFVLPFYSHEYHKIENYLSFGQIKGTNLSQFRKNYSTFYLKNCR